LKDVGTFGSKRGLNGVWTQFTYIKIKQAQHLTDKEREK